LKIYKEHVDRNKPICELCGNSHYLLMPNFKQIIELKQWNDILTHKTLMPFMSTACHLCHPEGIDLDINIVRTFKQSLNKWNRGEEYLNLIILCARLEMLTKWGKSMVDYKIGLYHLHELHGEYNKEWMDYYYSKRNYRSLLTDRIKSKIDEDVPF